MGRKRRILVVDDDPLFADGLTAIFELKGYEVECCYSGRECIERALKFDPDVIISDHVMGDMTGLQVLRALHGNKGVADPPFIVITGFKTQSLARQFEAAGASMVISKSEVSRRLLDLVDELLSENGKP